MNPTDVEDKHSEHRAGPAQGSAQPAPAPSLAEAAPAKHSRGPAKFVTGSTMRHVMVMTATGSIGLIAIFAVDLLSLLYVSWLGRPELTAAVGFATIVLFLTTAFNIGFMIAVGALVSRALGAGDRKRAREIGSSSLTLMVAVAAIVAVAVLLVVDPLLALLGATGETLARARVFLWITLPSGVAMALGMGYSGVLRGVGDARRSMYVTLIGGLVTAMLDPVLIFVLQLGTDGAAIATVVSRIAFAVVGYWGAVRVHDLVAQPDVAIMRRDARAVFAIAAPTILTNLATPVASGVLTGVYARYGDDVVAANAIMDRIVPVAFGVTFALSGAIGPILGQNWGAGHYHRMRQALRDAVVFTSAYVGLVGTALALASPWVPAAFGVTGPSAAFLSFLCVVSGPIWLFAGYLFVANAAFNNLGFPLYATAFNWGRATLGTIPFALVGARYDGVQGVALGVLAGVVLFGTAALLTSMRCVATLQQRDKANASPSR